MLIISLISSLKKTKWLPLVLKSTKPNDSTTEMKSPNFTLLGLFIILRNNLLLFNLLKSIDSLFKLRDYNIIYFKIKNLEVSLFNTGVVNLVAYKYFPYLYLIHNAISGKYRENFSKSLQAPLPK